MNILDLLLCVVVMGGGMAARLAVLADPPAELLQNLELLDDLPLVQDEVIP